ncbi:hypothetical protein K3495_g13384 [Podosphaera aphanis]|nr:hypothetical protein K3495_g13384 [Podosphaera aphanis]
MHMKTVRRVRGVKKAVQSRFPTKYSTVRSEKLIEQDLYNLAQEASEPLSEYYGRAQHLLRRTNTREEPSENNPLSISEKVLLQLTITAFLKGLHEKDLRKAMLTRPRPEKLKEAFESIQQLSEGMKQMEEVERVEAERMEFETLRQQYFERHGRPLISVFSEIQPHNRDKLSS